MAKWIEGGKDILQATSGVIAHGVNCQGVMGSGVAAALRKRYPEIMGNDQFGYTNLTTKYLASDLLGTVDFCTVSDELTIANCFTQDKYGTQKRQVNYEAIALCFEELESSLYEGEMLHIPKIGAGLAGGNWEIIRTIIDQTYSGEVTLWVP